MYSYLVIVFLRYHCLQYLLLFCAIIAIKHKGTRSLNITRKLKMYLAKIPLNTERKIIKGLDPFLLAQKIY